MSPGACTVVFYHYIRDVERTEFPQINALSVADFHSQLDWLQSRHQIIDHALLEASVLHGAPIPEAAALLTFDDGLVDHYETVLPILRARGLTGTFFVAGAALRGRLLNVHRTHFLLARLGAAPFAASVWNELDRMPDQAVRSAPREGVYRYDRHVDSDAKRLLNYELPAGAADLILDRLFERHLGDARKFASELYLSPAMIGEMAAAGMTFGFHGENHRVLARLTYEQQRGELCDGIDRVRQLTGQRSVPFCYPYGHVHTYNRDTLAILAEAGYTTAFNTVREPVRPGTAGRFELPRFDTKDIPRSAEAPVDA